MTANPQTLTAGAPKARRDFEDLPPVRREDRRILGVRVSLFPKILAPVVVGVLALIVWHLIVVFFDIPHYVLPRPWLVIQTLFKDWGTLSPSLWVTLRITGLAFLCAAVGGLIISVLFTLSKWVEMSFFPYAVTLQVTPIVAIAPLIIIWAGNVFPDQGIGIALLISAWIVAFFPIVSNTTLGLNSTDHNLLNLFQLYGASRWQILWHLRLPNALPYFLGGLRISGGLALIGAVVAEFVSGTGGDESGLAYRILESGYRLNIPRMFAALIMISLSGILIFLVLTLFQHLLLRKWHESAVKREN